jgi:hypothetical protein
MFPFGICRNGRLGERMTSWQTPISIGMPVRKTECGRRRSDARYAQTLAWENTVARPTTLETEGRIIRFWQSALYGPRRHAFCCSVNTSRPRWRWSQNKSLVLDTSYLCCSPLWLQVARSSPTRSCLPRTIHIKELWGRSRHPTVAWLATPWLVSRTSCQIGCPPILGYLFRRPNLRRLFLCSRPNLPQHPSRHRRPTQRRSRWRKNRQCQPTHPIQSSRRIRSKHLTLSNQNPSNKRARGGKTRHPGESPGTG